METWRAEFPILESGIYLLNNALGAPPRGIRAMLDRYADEMLRLGEHGWQVWYPWVLEAADRVGRLVGAPPGTTVLDSSVTTLLHRVASALDFRGDRPRVVTSALDFPSVGYAWQGWTRHGAELVVVPSEDGIRVSPERLAEAIDERTGAVSVSLATYCSGALLDLTPVIRKARSVGAIVIVDAFQAFGVVPIDVVAQDIDVLISGTRKFALGAGESAFLSVRRELLDRLEPLFVGWFAHRDPFAFQRELEYAPDARRFSMGTPLVLPHYVASVGWGILESVGLEAIRARSLELTGRIMDWADELRLEVATPRAPEARGGVVCLKFDGAEAVTKRLNQLGIGCSYRPASGLRLGPHFFNTLDEIDRAMGAIAEQRKEIAC
jgi:selenocysteine lyase/cysteine desulfurase